MAAFDFCAMLSSPWHLATNSEWLNSERGFLAPPLDGVEDPDDDIVAP